MQQALSHLLSIFLIASTMQGCVQHSSCRASVCVYAAPLHATTGDPLSDCQLSAQLVVKGKQKPLKMTEDPALLPGANCYTCRWGRRTLVPFPVGGVKKILIAVSKEGFVDRVEEIDFESLPENEDGIAIVDLGGVELEPVEAGV